MNDRFVDFDNKSNPKAQIDLLLEKIERIVSSYDPYSMKDFNDAQNALKEEKQKLQKEKELEIQKRENEEKQKVAELYSKDVQKLKEKLNEKQLELDTLVETKSNQSGLTSKDVSSKNDAIENVGEHQEKKFLTNKTESFGKDPQEIYRFEEKKNSTGKKTVNNLYILIETLLLCRIRGRFDVCSDFFPISFFQTSRFS